MRSASSAGKHPLPQAWLIGIVLFLVAQALFTILVQFPVGLNFDEFHYVPSAKQFLEWRANQNWEHPPLGKMIMAVGIAIGGDRPFGWRLMSTIFGSLTLVGMYAWGAAIFRDKKAALWVALLCLVNHLLFVQARIGMLDTFMFAFLAWAAAAFCAAWNSELTRAQIRPYMLATGALLGLATACKWFGVMAWALCIGLVVSVHVLHSWKLRFESQAADDFYSPRLWRDVRVTDWVLWLGVVPLAFYFVTFVPLMLIEGGSPLTLITMQAKMYDGQLRVVTSHPYMSNWPTWPLMQRPIWYAFDKEGAQGEFARGVVLLGNPLVMWSGLLALFGCLWGWLFKKDRAAFLILAFYAAFYFSWALIPRKVSFYYYYYPAGMVLSLALAWCFQRLDAHFGAKKTGWLRWAYWGLAAAVFVYFYPILAARQIPADSFRKWMWFGSWI